MPSGDPIAVAFVEVRPETEDFRGTAERDLTQSLGPEGLEVSGRFNLQGLDVAKRDVDALTSELRDVQGTQLQFDGLSQAGADAGVLAEGLAQARDVDLAGTLGQTEQAMGQLSSSATELAQSVSSIPTEVAPDLSGLDDASTQVDALTQSAGGLGDTIGTTATAAGALIARQEQLAAASRNTVAGLTLEQQQLRETAVQEENLLRVRARRAAAVGPFRLAGIGLGVGTAIFAATRALGDLQEGLRVTGDEASSTGGKLRNVASDILSFDLVGIFRDLADNTQTYSRAQLLLISQTPQLTTALNELGQAGNIARSTVEALASLSAPPQFLQTALAREQAGGSLSGQIDVLEQQLAFFKRAEGLARRLAQSQEQRNAILEPIFANEKRIQDQLKDLRQQRQAGGGTTGGARAAGAVDLSSQLAGELRSLEREQAKLRNALPKGQVAGSDLERARTQLAAVNKKIEEEQKRITAEQQRHVDEVNRSMRGDRAEHFTASAVVDVDTTELAALERTKAQLEASIARKEVDAADLRRDHTRLKSVNKEIEAVRKAIAEENRRHAEAVRDTKLQTFRIGVLEAETTAGDTTAALQAEKREIERQLGLKNISKDERERLLGELKSINSAIESLATAAADEAERHRDAIRAAQDKADQAFIDSVASREHAARNRQLIAQATASLADDIRVSEQLQQIFKESIAQARKTILDAKLRAETIAQLTSELLQEELSEKALRQQRRQARIDRREESLDLDIQLAQARDNKRAEIRAHQAKIDFLQERIRHTRAATNQRKRLRVEIARERAEIKQLEEDLGETSKSNFGEQAVKFLQDLQGFSSTIASNLFPSTTTIGTRSTAPSTSGPSTPPRRPPVSSTEDRVPSPFEHRRGGTQTTQADVAADLRDTRGAPVTQSQAAELIQLAKKQVAILRDVRAGLGHPEATHARRQGRHKSTTSVD